jgi:hypothetical protein
MSEQEQLKPCPMCGAEARAGISAQEEFVVHCISCPANVWVRYSEGTEQDAINAWNARAQQPVAQYEDISPAEKLSVWKSVPDHFHAEMINALKKPVAEQEPYAWCNAGTYRQQTTYASFSVGSENPWKESANAFPLYTAQQPAQPVVQAPPKYDCSSLCAEGEPCSISDDGKCYAKPAAPDGEKQ